VVDPIIWLAFGAAIIAMLALDLVLERRTAGAVPSMRASAIWSVIWTLVALAFALILLPWRGGTAPPE
jgi:tellurite resistance protein TerC